MRGAQVNQLFTLIAVPISVALAALRLNAPILAGAVLMLGLGATLALVMPEQHFHPTHSRAVPRYWFLA